MTPSSQKFRASLKQMRVTAAEREQFNRHIAGCLPDRAPHIGDIGFNQIHATDVRCLFELYDATYFDGLLTATAANIPLEFRVSSRMTRAGGKTSSWRPRRGGSIERFEIAISSTLLLETFADDESTRSIVVTGLECDNRQQALMRVMEHEVVHLCELLGWGDSSCRQDRFQTFAWQIFGHTNHQHSLITPRERAAAVGVHPGARVEFDVRGQTLTGIVNRVTRRATVLVPSADGESFNDGNTYRRFYVPVQALRPVTDG